MSEHQRFGSIRTRLTALFVAIFGLTLIFFCSVFYVYFTRINQNNFDLALFNHAVDVDETVNFDFFGAFSVDPNAISGLGKAFPLPPARRFCRLPMLAAWSGSNPKT